MIQMETTQKWFASIKSETSEEGDIVGYPVIGWVLQGTQAWPVIYRKMSHMTLPWAQMETLSAEEEPGDWLGAIYAQSQSSQ